MGSKKKILIVFLGLLCVLSSLNYTYAYLEVNEKVKDTVNLSIGTIASNFINVDEKTPYSSAIVNISNLTPGGIQNSEFFIKNTGSLTNKVTLRLDCFNGNGMQDLLPYLSYSLIINNKSYEGKLTDLASNEKYFNVLDNSSNVLLMKNNDMTKCSLTIKLDKNTPYSAQNKSIKFNISICATQPNDPDWIKK